MIFPCFTVTFSISSVSVGFNILCRSSTVTSPSVFPLGHAGKSRISAFYLIEIKSSKTKFDTKIESGSIKVLDLDYSPFPELSSRTRQRRLEFLNMM